MSLEAKLLESIRDGIMETNQRLDQTNERLETGFAAVNQRIDQTNERLETGFAAVNQRIDQTNGQLSAAVDTLGDLIAGTNKRIDSLDEHMLSFRVEVREKFDGIGSLFIADSRELGKFDQRIVKLERRMDKLEGLGETG